MACGIYKITNNINGKVYIGQSINIEKRWEQHKGCYCDNLLSKAFIKYGINNFTFEILEECNQEELDDKEIFYISYYDSYNNGYNNTLGGQKGRKFDRDLIINLWEEGKTTVQIEKIIGASKGTVLSALHGTLPSDEIQKRAYNMKTILQYDFNKNLIKTFKSFAEAARYNNLTSSNIFCSVHKKNKVHDKYFFIYEEEKNNLDDIIIQINTDKRCQGKKIMQFNLKGELLKTYISAAEAARDNGLKSSTGIIQMCEEANSIIKTCANSIFLYEENYTEEKLKILVEKANIPKKYNPKKTKVKQYDKNNNFLKTFNSLTEATEELGMDKRCVANISACCRGKQKTAYGYIWKYAD